MKKNPFSVPIASGSNSNETLEQRSKYPKTIHDSKANFWLPDDVWLYILKFVHIFSSSEYFGLYILPYALANKKFYGFFNKLSNSHASSLSLIVHALVGKKNVGHFLNERSYLHSVFLHIKENIGAITKQVDFKHVTLVLERNFCDSEFEYSDFTFVQDYQANDCFEISCVDKPFDIKPPTPTSSNAHFFKKSSYDVHFPGNEKLGSFTEFESKVIKKGEIIDELFKISTDVKQILGSICENSDCHYALMAFAYFKSLKGSYHHFINLAVLFAEMGLLKGTLFILEMCERYNIWAKCQQTTSSQDYRNQTLKKVLFEALRYGELGEDIARYIMNNFEFQYTATFVYQTIDNTRPSSSYLPIHMLALDSRHYLSTDEYIKFFLVAYHMIQSYQAENPGYFSEEQKSILLKLDFLSSLPIPEYQQDDSIAKIKDDFETYIDELLYCLKNFAEILEQSMDKLDLRTTMVQFVNEARDRNSDKEKVKKEPVGDLQPFLEGLPIHQSKNAGKTILEETSKQFNLDVRTTKSNFTVHL